MHQRQIFEWPQQREHATQKPEHLQQERKDEMSASSETPLEKHVKIFSTLSNGERIFTRESIQAGMQALNTTESDASRIAGNTMIGAYKGGCLYAKLYSGKLCNGTLTHGGGFFHFHDIIKLIHSEDTGVFTKAGEFNEKAFQDLTKCAVKDPVSGKMALSFDNILERKSHSGQEQRWPITPNRLSLKHYYDKTDQRISNIASKAEFEMLLGKFADIEINGVKYISVDKLRKFYTESDKIFADYAEQVKLEKSASPSPGKK